MQLVFFSKSLADHDVDGLIRRARELGVDGYDLCVRPGHLISPDNAATELPRVARRLQEAGLSAPMVTGNFDLLLPDHPTALPILSAMEKAGINLLKLGYSRMDPVGFDYWAEVDRLRRALEGWEKLGREHGVRVCYHTHSGNFMGLNCAALMHLIKDRDPAWIGAYIDPGHMAINGEPFDLGLTMVHRHLAIVGLKDAMVTRVAAEDEGRAKSAFVEAGQGMVAWSAVFAGLRRVGFDGPLSIHAECEIRGREEFLAAAGRAAAYFRRRMNP